MPKYSVEPGRIIAVEGIPVVSLRRIGDDAAGYTITPWEADYFTHTVVNALNKYTQAAEALAAMVRLFPLDLKKHSLEQQEAIRKAGEVIRS